MLTEDEKVAAIARFGFDKPEPTPITMNKRTLEVRIDKADWFCQYCPEPLGSQAVTTSGGYAHRTCHPLFKIIDHDVEAAYRRLNSEATAAEPSTSPEGVREL